MRPYVLQVEAALSDLSISETSLGTAAMEALKRGGKRMRPCMALLACEAVSGNSADAIQIAIAYELAHTASLAQDDIIDESDTRRGGPSVHRLIGTKAAILVSDALLFKIYGIIGGYAQRSLSMRRLQRLLEQFGDAATKMAEGEFLELRAATRQTPTEDDYLEIAGLKTGALFGAAVASGVIVGGGTDRQAREGYAFGYDIGISFQIVDDILDVTGDSAVIGKPVLKDLQNSGTNIVIIHALANGNPRQRSAITSLMYRKSYGIESLRELKRTLSDLGSVEYASKLAGEHSMVARRHLHRFPRSDAREKLEELIEMVEDRRS